MTHVKTSIQQKASKSMRDFSTPRTFILSAYQGTSAAHDRAAHCNLVADLALEGVPFRECEGSFEGNYEQVCIVTGAASQDTVQALAESYNQACYLVIAEHDRITYEVSTTTGFHKHIGKLTNVGTEKPVDAAGWTCCDGQYFVTSPRVGVDLPGGL